MATGILTSFWYYRTYDFDLIPTNVPLILDSGAFSAYTSGGAVDIVEYAKWVNNLAHRIDFAFNLDVLGDHQASLSNWETLADYGVNAVPVIHYGDRADEVLPAYATRGGLDRLALGGIAVSGAGRQVQAWSAHVFKWLREHSPHTLTHGLGVHMRSKMSRLPWDTTDSSSFTSAWRYARMALWDDRAKKWITVSLNGKDLYRYGRIVRDYGVEPSTVAKANVESSLDLVRLVTRIECTAAEHYDTASNRYLALARPLLATAAREVDRYLVETSTTRMPHLARELSHQNEGRER